MRVVRVNWLAAVVTFTVVMSPTLGATAMSQALAVDITTLNPSLRCGMFDTCTVDTSNVEVMP
jgi:hypothetical protein